MAVNVPVKVTTEKLSRSELLKWVNHLLHSYFDKIEQLGTGAAYCVLMDMLFPNLIPIKRVICRTNLERECFHNFKILQVAFEKLKIIKDIPIEKIIKGRYLDNLEFLQWFKRFYDANDKRNNQNATAEDRSSKAKQEDRSKVPVKGKRQPQKNDLMEPKPVAKNALCGGGDTSEPSAVAALREQLEFYFAKLRDIEDICLKSDANGKVTALQDILVVLYETREAQSAPKRTTSKKVLLKRSNSKHKK